MRIRKRWPAPPSPHLPPLWSSSLSPPQLTPVAPDLTSSTPQPPPPSLVPSSEPKRSLHPDSDLPLAEENHHHLRPPSDSAPSPPLRRPKLEDRQRSDLQLTMNKGTDGWICSSTEIDESHHSSHQLNCMHSSPTSTQDSQAGEEEEVADDKRFAAATNRRNESNPGAGTSSGVGISVSSSSSFTGRWVEGERAFPLKKRRGSFERKVSDDAIVEKEKRMKSRVKTKAANKWVHEEEEEEDDGDDKREEEEEDTGDDGEQQRQRKDVVRLINGTSAKKRGGGGVVMEGSRCSRVNGRGWRCCQQTLVGYSLCEHHLGKGRLRSMSSVRNQASAMARARPKKEKEQRGLSSSMSQQQQQQLNSFKEEMEVEDEEEEEEEEEKPLTIRKKRKKIGMVKARSISSLLGQTQYAPAIILQPSTPSDPHPSISSNVMA